MKYELCLKIRIQIVEQLTRLKCESRGFLAVGQRSTWGIFNWNCMNYFSFYMIRNSVFINGIRVYHNEYKYQMKQIVKHSIVALTGDSSNFFVMPVDILMQLLVCAVHSIGRSWMRFRNRWLYTIFRNYQFRDFNSDTRIWRSFDRGIYRRVHRQHIPI